MEELGAVIENLISFCIMDLVFGILWCTFRILLIIYPAFVVIMLAFCSVHSFRMWIEVHGNHKPHQECSITSTCQFRQLISQPSASNSIPWYCLDD